LLLVQSSKLARPSLQPRGQIQPSQESRDDVGVFRNGALLDPLQPELLPGHEVLVEDGRIRKFQIGRSNRQRSCDRFESKTLMPGLIDLHVHVIAVEFNLPRRGDLAQRTGHAARRALERAMLREVHQHPRCRRRGYSVQAKRWRLG